MKGTSHMSLMRRRAETRNNAGALIRKKRLELGLSMRKLAHTLGVSEQFVSHIELGKIKLPIERAEDFGNELSIETDTFIMALTQDYTDRVCGVMKYPTFEIGMRTAAL